MFNTFHGGAWWTLGWQFLAHTLAIHAEAGIMISLV